MLTLASEQTWALKTSSELWKATSLFEKTRLLRSLFCCSSNDSQSIFFFFIFTYVVLFSFCTQIFLFTRCEVAENNNCRQWLKNNHDSLPVNNCWSWIWVKRVKQTLIMCSFPYFLMIQFAAFNLLEWRPSHGPIFKNSYMVNHGLSAKLATDLLLSRSLVSLFHTENSLLHCQQV